MSNENVVENDSLEKAETPSAKAKKKGITKALYDWVLHWADTPYGTPALFLISFAESSFFPIPPDVLQVALSVSKPKRSFYYAAVSTVASVLGALLGFFIGYVLWSSVGDTVIAWIPGLSQEAFDKVEGMYKDNAFLTIFGAAFSPIPYKVFTIAAGICQISLPILIVASALGRSGRFFLVAAFIRVFGPSVKDLIEKYFGLATLAFFILLVGGFAVIKLLLH